MKYEKISEYSNTKFRRITGVKRATFDKMVEILRKGYTEKPALRENAKAEHRESAAGYPGISAGISYIRPHSGQLRNSRKQYLPRDQMGRRYAHPGWNLFAAWSKSVVEK